MEDLILKPKKDMLGVTCGVKTGIVKLEGTSYPEDAVSFFQPIWKWLEDYVEKIEQPITLNLKVDYINSSTTKCMFYIFEILEIYYKNGGSAKVFWYYRKNDKDIEDVGKEFKEDLELPFEMVSY